MDQLPKDLLLEIFDYLPESSLINAAETCTSWSDIIKNSTNFMLRIKIRMQSDKIVIPLIDGKHQVIEIQKFDNFFDPKGFMTILKTIETYQSSLKQLILCSVKFKNFLNFLQLFENLHHLTTLQITSCHVHNDKDIQETIELPNLRNLKVSLSNKTFLSLLECNQLVKFEAYYDSKIDHQEFQGTLSNFLEGCKNLRELSLCGSIESHFDATRNYEFRLTKLTIDLIMDTWIDFLKLQQDSLKHLILPNLPNGKVLQKVLANLTNLTTLELGIDLQPQNIPEFNLLENNFTLKTLHIYGHVSYRPDICGLLQHYPNIETLKFLKCKSTDISELLSFISDNLKNLKHLTVPLISGVLSPSIKFLNLESLEVEKQTTSDQVTNLMNLLIYSPNIERLIIGEVENEHLSVEALISKVENLRELDLGSKFIYDKEALNIIKMSAKKLNKIKIYTRDLEGMKTLVEQIHGDGLNCFIEEISEPQVQFKQINFNSRCFEQRRGYTPEEAGRRLAIIMEEHRNLARLLQDHM